MHHLRHNSLPSLPLSPLQHRGLASDIVWPRQLHPELGGEEHLVHLHVQSLPRGGAAGHHAHHQLHSGGAAAVPPVPGKGGGSVWRQCADECQDIHSTHRYRQLICLMAAVVRGSRSN